MKSIPTTTARSTVSLLRNTCRRVVPSADRDRFFSCSALVAPPHQRTPGYLDTLIHLDDVLLRLAGIFLQIAYCSGVIRFALREGLDEHWLLVLHLGEMDVEDGMMGLRIERHASARRVNADAALERLDHLLAIQRASLFDSGGPEQHALIARHRQIGDRWIVHSEFGSEALEELLVDGVVERFQIIVGDHDAVALLRRKHELLVGAGEGRRCDRNFPGQARGVELPIE